MSQAISRRSFLKCAGSGAVSLAAALLTGVSAAAAALRAAGAPALLILAGHARPVGDSFLLSRRVSSREVLYSLGSGVTAACNGRAVRCGSFAAPLYGENAADASIFTLNLAAGRGALLRCFCAVPEDWQTLELTYAPDFAAGRSVTFTVQRGADEADLGMVPATPAEVGSVVDL